MLWRGWGFVSIALGWQSGRRNRVPREGGAATRIMRAVALRLRVRERENMRMVKKILLYLAVAAMLTVTFIGMSPRAQTTARPIQILINGAPLTVEVAPVMRTGRVLVPMRAIFEALGAKVTWQDDLSVIRATHRQTAIVLQIGNHTAWASGTRRRLDVPPVLIETRTMVPIRFVSEALGAEVSWNEATHTVTINHSPVVAQPPANRIPITFWHGLAQPLGGILEAIAADFNASQDRYEVQATFRGSYPETMVSAIAAFRAGRAPHIVQMFEVGTGTMMAATGAVMPVHQLMRDTGVPFDPSVYLPAVRGYYSLPDGRMMALPFNSSTAVMFYNKDAFRAAGLDPERPPRTWSEVRAAAQRIRATNAASIGFTTSWPTWTQFEQFSALHDFPLATRANGMEGMDAVLAINSPLHVRHVQMLLDMHREGSFTYGGRDSAGDALFVSGQAAIIHASSGLRARILRDAKFAWGVAMLPHHDDVRGAPRNSIIGGAAFWAMTAPGRSADEYRGVAEFFRFVGQPHVAAWWHMDTGFVPITFPAFELTESIGYYRRHAGTDLPYRQLTRTEPTENSRGLRLGNMPEIRVVIQEELESVFQGRQTAQQAMDNAVARGNEILRAFERINRP